ncbi:hypothetical protein [Cyanobium sp. WAJ14-Wanaka]|uniref:hypothetical protein n=1 Tax=Cyanobium sp. WAJ14-Wanaka TaxID=2823725 RepID=UPI0020CEC8DC|nr:hypothetical protein [Cyanobium sp. WAJ14-Wanaka]MCP9775695.1 hypothetical protein [Cyanobium sp. WAJ14-Wanaka]
MVFVTGCHRSGTSLLASLLGDVLGQRRGDDLPPGPDNPRGFFESRLLTEFNDELLHALGGDWSLPPLLPPSWSDPPLLDLISGARDRFAAYGEQGPWLDKDPRLCITLPAIQHLLLRRVPVVVALRNPLEVACSLQLRNGFALERGLALWFIYNHHLAATLQPADLLISQAELIAAPTNGQLASQLLAALGGFLEGHGHQPPTAQAWQQMLANRVDPGLNRAVAALPASPAMASLHPRLVELVEATYQQALCGIRGHRSAFSSLPLEVLQLCAKHQLCAPGASLQQRLSQLETQCEQLTTQCELDQETLRAIRGSSSWQITAPLRWLSALLRRLLDRRLLDRRR